MKAEIKVTRDTFFNGQYLPIEAFGIDGGNYVFIVGASLIQYTIIIPKNSPFAEGLNIKDSLYIPRMVYLKTKWNKDKGEDEIVEFRLLKQQ